MTSHTSRPSRDDVLNAFAVEPTPGRETLERYLRDYPDLADDLIDLSRELSRDYCEDKEPLSPEDEALIDAAWRRHQESTRRTTTNPFDALSPDKVRDLAMKLEVPRQIITAFRDRQVETTSVPRHFLSRLAAALDVTLGVLVDILALPQTPDPARSYKSNAKPHMDAPVSFERLLIDAGVPDEKRFILMTDDN
ncbi:hypothetical protein D7Y15_40795 [Corallococcus sp. AB030]|uniref:hypothetical protein n=1 Tax=Corallococcus sp. AB030 TaxID=2316716 RepID=UPI000EED87BE|nr:hypothetical protein [Corallococcus sp. AB030]RKH97263.1 hypothetical protein D7Y15_40795 [Corallococcus sp. AB030]